MADIKLINDNCYEYLKSLPDNSVDLVITDPPYEIIGGGGGGAFGSDKRSYHDQYINLYIEEDDENYKAYKKALENGDEEEAERNKIIYNKKRQRKSLTEISKGIKLEILDELDRIMKKTNIYIWCNKNLLFTCISHYKDKGYNMDVLCWHKTNPVPSCNNSYLSDTEYCLFVRDKGVKVYGEYKTKKKYYITPTNTEDKKLYKHPTIKPLYIIENLIINSSITGGLC